MLEKTEAGIATAALERAGLAGVAITAGLAAMSFAAFGAAGVLIYGVMVASEVFATYLAWKRGDPLQRPFGKNILANGGVGAVLAFAWLVIPDARARPALAAAFVGSFAAAFADSLAHEAGVTFGGRPRLITTWRRTETGEPGGVSMIGSFAGLLAATTIALLGWSAGLVSSTAIGWIVLGGCVGNVVDSFLGATLERRGLIDADMGDAGCALAGALTVLVVFRRSVW